MSNWHWEYTFTTMCTRCVQFPGVRVQWVKVITMTTTHQNIFLLSFPHTWVCIMQNLILPNYKLKTNLLPSHVYLSLVWYLKFTFHNWTQRWHGTSLLHTNHMHLTHRVCKYTAYIAVLRLVRISLILKPSPLWLFWVLLLLRMSWLLHTNHVRLAHWV